MPFITDATWTPATYRKASAVWSANAPANDNEIAPRRARSTTPRHAALADTFAGLLRWRQLAEPVDWTSMVAANDNDDEADDRPAPLSLDSRMEIRPRDEEMLKALGQYKVSDRRQARLGGGGPVMRIVSDGDIERAPIASAAGGRGTCIVRVGALHFSDGSAEEPALIRNEAGQVRRGSVRLPLGALRRVGDFRPGERYGKPKGAPLLEADVHPSQTASPGAVEFADPVEAAQEAKWIREAVGELAADVLDTAISAANFADVGRRLGYQGKTAERRGQVAVRGACTLLDAVLAAAA